MITVFLLLFCVSIGASENNNNNDNNKEELFTKHELERLGKEFSKKDPYYKPWKKTTSSSKNLEDYRYKYNRNRANKDLHTQTLNEKLEDIRKTNQNEKIIKKPTLSKLSLKTKKNFAQLIKDTIKANNKEK